jgi:hypothetical protein
MLHRENLGSKLVLSPDLGPWHDSYVGLLPWAAVAVWCLCLGNSGRRMTTRSASNVRARPVMLNHEPLFASQKYSLAPSGRPSCVKSTALSEIIPTDHFTHRAAPVRQIAPFDVPGCSTQVY